MAPHLLLRGDLNSKVGGLKEITHVHSALLMGHPVLQLARWQCSAAQNSAHDSVSLLVGVRAPRRCPLADLKNPVE